MESEKSKQAVRSKAFVVSQDGRKICVTESQTLGYTLRNACEPCRIRKLRCSGLINGDLSCYRCGSDNVECYFSMYGTADIQHLGDPSDDQESDLYQRHP